MTIKLNTSNVSNLYFKCLNLKHLSLSSLQEKTYACKTVLINKKEKSTEIQKNEQI